MKENQKEEKFVKICPKCNSFDLKIDFTMVFLGDTSTSTCNGCGYTNTFFPEVEISKMKNFGKK